MGLEALSAGAAYLDRIETVQEPFAVPDCLTISATEANPLISMYGLIAEQTQLLAFVAAGGSGSRSVAPDMLASPRSGCAARPHGCGRLRFAAAQRALLWRPGGSSARA
jgi:hypothetical protein